MLWNIGCEGCDANFEAKCGPFQAPMRQQLMYIENVKLFFIKMNFELKK